MMALKDKYPEIQAVLDGESEGCIVQGDCLEILPRMPDGCVDAVVTDPPFAITGGLSSGRTSLNDTQFFEHWLVDVARGLISVSIPVGCMFLWCDWRTASVIDRAFSRASERYVPWWVSQIITHDRDMIGMGSPFRNQCDWIAVVRGRKTDWAMRIPKTTPNIFREYSYYGKHDHHPAEKTVTAAGRLVGWATSQGGIILDPFCGSGTTCVAAKELGRRWIGIELDPKYCEIARSRVQNTERPLFAEPEPCVMESGDLLA